MNSWKERLDERTILVLDGAWGTELAKRGLPVGEAPEKWNLEHPDVVRSVAQAYVDAGSDIILTNTFGGNRFKLGKSCPSANVEDVNRRGVELSKEAADDKALVFASIGPTGEFMEPLGTVSEQDMIDCFAQQVRAITKGGADGIVIETMSDLGEAKAALKAVRENSFLPVAVSMTFQKGAERFATMMGVSPEQAAEELTAAGADIIGANCGAGIDEMIQVIEAMHRVTDRPLWAKPNAGLPELVDGRTVFRETPEEMAQQLPLLVEAGAVLVGGCCGTTPEHIRVFAREAVNIAQSGASYLDSVSKMRKP